MSIITHEKPPTRIGLTITFKRALELEMDHKAQYYYTRRVISKHIGAASKDFRFMPEFMLNGRIHYHGWIDIINMPKWQTITLPEIRKLGRCKLEYNLSEKWYIYMNKSLVETRKILKFKPDIVLSVSADDYKQWVKDNSEQPTIEDFNIKPKMTNNKVLPSTDTLSVPPSMITPPSEKYYLHTVNDIDYYTHIPPHKPLSM